MPAEATRTLLDRDAWGAERDAFARALGGAALFGMPLLFTMEMWWIGEFQPRLQLLSFVLLALLANIALARMSGFRRDFGSWTLDVWEAIEAMAVGVVLSVAVLGSLARIDSSTSFGALVGMVAVQVVPLSLGAMVGNLLFRGARTGDEGGTDGDGSSGHGRRTPVQELANDVAATFVGALFVGFAIAPTEEVPMLTAGLSLANVIGVVALTLFASYVIVFASGFDPSHHGPHEGGLFQRPFSETMLCYVVSLLAAGLLLLGFGQVAPGDPLYPSLVEVIVLSVPAAIGGAAGRVVV